MNTKILKRAIVAFYSYISEVAATFRLRTGGDISQAKACGYRLSAQDKAGRSLKAAATAMVVLAAFSLAPFAYAVENALTDDMKGKSEINRGPFLRLTEAAKDGTN